MKADVVIGAGFGDEGKGLMTDYLASQYEESIVIRFNGGAQAAHTVQTPEGGGHVFSHFGAGSFNNSHTYLSEYFIVNPITFVVEAIQLSQKKIMPKVLIHTHARVTTPFDMIINQLQGRGGTCGMGINETVLRHQYFPLTMGNLVSWDFDRIRLELTRIRDDYTIPRLKELKVDVPSFIRDVGIIANYLRDVQIMLRSVTVGKLKETTIPIIFEGAQGLLLDNDYDIEHGTPSKTGLHNVLRIAHGLGIKDLDVNYVIRAYMTRHGNGPFPTYNSEMSYEDVTNVPNTFQGDLRFGMLDFNLLDRAIQKDINHTFPIMTIPRIVVTHLDQMTPFVEYKLGEEVMTVHRSEMAKQMAALLSFDQIGESWGPTREDVRCHTW